MTDYLDEILRLKTLINDLGGENLGNRNHGNREQNRARNKSRHSTDNMSIGGRINRNIKKSRVNHVKLEGKKKKKVINNLGNMSMGDNMSVASRGSRIQ